MVSGPPGSGKSTLACQLAPALGLPLLAKDVIKDALLVSLPAEDVEWSRRLGRAAMDVLFALARGCPDGAVLEANYHRTLAASAIGALGGRTVEVFCRCPEPVARARFRARSGQRLAGHFDAVRTDAEIWHDEVNQPVAAGWPVIEADTSAPVDLATLVARLDAATG